MSIKKLWGQTVRCSMNRHQKLCMISIMHHEFVYRYQFNCYHFGQFCFFWRRSIVEEKCVDKLTEKICNKSLWSLQTCLNTQNVLFMGPIFVSITQITDCDSYVPQSCYYLFNVDLSKDIRFKIDSLFGWNLSLLMINKFSERAYNQSLIPSFPSLKKN
jgi:hypothetical protein